MTSDVERPFPDRTGDPHVLRKAVELHLLGRHDDPDPPTGPLGPGDIGRDFGVASGRRTADEITRSDQPGDPPEVARTLQAKTEEPGCGVAVE